MLAGNRFRSCQVTRYYIISVRAVDFWQCSINVKLLFSKIALAYPMFGGRWKIEVAYSTKEMLRLLLERRNATDRQV